MAVDAFVRRALVNNDRLVAGELGLNVTLGASHIRVSPCQGEMGSRIVIER